MSFTGYLRHKLRQAYQELPALLWLLGLIGVPAAASRLGRDGSAALVVYLLLSGLGYGVWVDYQAWKKEARP